MATTQADELRELVREANGVRGDLERAMKEAKKIVPDMIANIKAEVEETIQLYIDGQYDLLQRQFDRVAAKLVADIQYLTDVLIGKVPAPRRIAKESGAASLPAGMSKPFFYPDLEKLCHLWPGLSPHQKATIAGLMSTSIDVATGKKGVRVLNLSDADLPSDVRDALKSFR